MVERLRKNENGNMYIQILLTMLFITIIFLFFVELMGVVVEYQNVSHASKKVAKIIECEGQVTDSVDDYLEAYNMQSKMDMTYKISNVEYCNPAEKKIQFRKPFTVTVEYTSEIKLLSPIFTEKPIYFTLPMRADITGMSEVYWK